MTMIEKLAQDMYKEIREAKDNAATIQDFQIEKRLIEDAYDISFQHLVLTLTRRWRMNERKIKAS